MAVDCKTFLRIDFTFLCDLLRQSSSLDVWPGSVGKR